MPLLDGDFMDKTLSLFAFGVQVHTTDSHPPKLMLDQMAGDGFFHLDKNSYLFIQTGYKIHLIIRLFLCIKVPVDPWRVQWWCCFLPQHGTLLKPAGMGRDA